MGVKKWSLFILLIAFSFGGFSQNNKINTTIIGNSNPFTAEVTNYISPWLYGYGGGLRTLFLGYYVKLDVAWGVLNYSVQTPKVYLTIGYDF